jgi:hypothetical protein
MTISRGVGTPTTAVAAHTMAQLRQLAETGHRDLNSLTSLAIPEDAAEVTKPVRGNSHDPRLGLKTIED